MARARNLKPGFFRNADLAELPFEARLLFAGLWTLADRDGRLEDKAKQIKIELFPADNVDCDALLDLICKTKMLERYEVDGVRYLQVVNFNKHQNPHRDEKPSTIPVNDKHGASTVQAQCKQEINTVSIGLTPDSGFLTADSLIPDSLIGQDKPAKQAKRRSQIPDDFYPNDDNLFAFNKTQLNLGHEIGKFMDYHQAKGSVMADWQAAWRTWVGNAIKFSAKGKPVESFKERDDRNARKRWEEMTGQIHPDNLQNIFDSAVKADNLMLEVSP
jgi:hypothetical protein